MLEIKTELMLYSKSKMKSYYWYSWDSCVSWLFPPQTNFQELSLEKAREQARAENKPIFLDCYTSWCGSCKMMANDVSHA